MQGPNPNGSVNGELPPTRHNAWPAIGLALLASATFLGFLLARPRDSAFVTAGDDLGTIACELIGLLCCAIGLHRASISGARPGVGHTWRRSRRWGLILITCGLAATTLGDSVWAADEVGLGRTVSSPSWVDGIYLASYPFLLVGILLLARRRASHFSKPRVAIDACMGITTAITLSWYFVLGPTLFQGAGSMAGTLVNTAYPVGDLLLVCCLLMLGLTHTADVSRLVTGALSLGLSAWLVSDCLYDYLSLHGTYATGDLLDVGWVLGPLLIGLGVLWAGSESPASGGIAVPPEADEHPTRWWQAVIFSVSLPLIVAFQIVVSHLDGPTNLETGVQVGTMMVIALVVLRQTLAALEIAHHARTLERLARTDALTGLPNRTALQTRLARAVRESQLSRRPVALLLLDIDNFKDINETCGHYAGDQLLRHLVPRLQSDLRPSDLLTRLGGDEFAAVVPGTSVTGAVAVSRALLHALEAPFVIDGQSIGLTASIGAALAPEHGTDVETLLQHADVAMYVAKRGALGCAVYDPLLDTHSATVLALTADLQRAIAEEQLVLHYQPQLLLQTDHVYGVEALVRWAHPAQGLLPPDRFIPLAERTGAIIPLTAWVIDSALGQCRAWLDAGIDLAVSVNISLRSLHDPGLCRTLEAALDRYALAPDRICLELTESMLMSDVTTAKLALQQLATLGIRLSIDDFGTGYSSLAYIAHLPVTEVKVDRSFVRRMTTDEPDAIVVASTLGLARSLGLRCVVEGVEDAETCKLLRSWHVDAVQGYHFSRPLPAGALASWLYSRPPEPQCTRLGVAPRCSESTLHAEPAQLSAAGLP